jgi:23S rRNA pseudouridine1911/1915/1917 synthase
MILRHRVRPDEDGESLRTVLTRTMRLSGSLLKRLRDADRLRVDGAFRRTIDPVRTGELVEADLDLREDAGAIEPGSEEPRVVFEDDALILLDKPPDMLVHPVFEHQFGTLANALSRHMSGRGERYAVRPVTRLDRDTSGLVLFAKNSWVHTVLIAQMRSHEFTKTYVGLVEGRLPADAGTVDLPIARAEGSLLNREIRDDGARAVTHYRVLRAGTRASLAAFVLETGRTHQIRVHLSAIGCPILGDSLYPGADGASRRAAPRQCLHAYHYRFAHPCRDGDVAVRAPLPEDILALIRACGLEDGLRDPLFTEP